MRQRFEQQITLGTVAIADVNIPVNSRDELPAVLKALQYIFIMPDLNDKVFKLLEEKIVLGKKKTGRTGMDLWHVLVLAVVRHATATNWDKLAHWSNFDELLRQVMGVHNTRFSEAERITFKYQSIIDNVSLIDEKLLRDINQLVVDAGHKMLKKKGDEAQELELKSDSFVVETNIHFPTDLNLLWDSIRKSFDMVGALQELAPVKGWRKIHFWRSAYKSLFRGTSQIVFKGKDEHKKKVAAQTYLDAALDLKASCEIIIKSPPVVSGSQDVISAIINGLRGYCDYVGKFCDQIERRLIKGEVIPPEEKIYSIFEPYTEWITKGKLDKKVELGLLMLVTTDQHQFIVDYKVMEKERDHAQVKGLVARLSENYPAAKITSHSFDKGFFSKENKTTLDQGQAGKAILPKKGKHSKADKERESDPEFKRLRRRHSAVESNINALEHNGLNRCMDKGIIHFKRYVGLSVLAYNLHIMGNELLEADRRKEKRRLRCLKSPKTTFAEAA
jgi:IS5 family transposase